MKLLFGNARFEAHRASGARTHIESLIHELHGLGHQVWVSQDSESEQGHRLPQGMVQRRRLLSQIDAIYLRFEGQPIRLARGLRLETALWAAQKPVVWEMNATSDYCSLMWRAEGRRVDLNRLDHRIGRQARQVQLAICNTGGLELYSRQLGIRRSTVSPLGSDPEFFRPDVPCCEDIRRHGSELNVVWCGSAEIRWHDLESIVSAAKLLDGKRNIRFFMVGRMDRLPGSPGNITFLGEVPRRRLPSVLSCMDVGVALYRRPSWSRFGVYSSPLKLFDYMASGLVVLASPIEQVAEIIRDGETGFLIPYGDSEALAAHILKIADRKVDSKKTIGLAARNLVLQHFNWRRVARDTASEIETVL